MKVSVAICTYNGSNFIEEQLTSIINQTVKPDEIILSDDGSSDNTLELAHKVLDTCDIKHEIMVNANKHGVVGNFTNAISKCTGDIIFTSDQDDCWVANKVERIVNEFIKDDLCVLVFTDAYTTDKDLNIKAELWNSISFDSSFQDKYSRDPYEVLFTKNVVTGATMALKRELFLKSIPMPNDALCLHDYWFALVAPLLGNTVLIKDKLIYYRLHGNNVVGANKLTVMQKIKRWFKNLKTDYLRNETNLELSEYMLKTYGDSCKDDVLERIRGWNEFCKWRKQNVHKWLIGIAPIIKRSLKGDYKKYSNMFMPELKDVAVCLFRLYK